MKNEGMGFHSKTYYVFRHVQGQDKLEYASTSFGYWTDYFSESQLMTYEAATRLAKGSKEMLGGNDGWTYVVGGMKVEVDPFFVPEVA